MNSREVRLRVQSCVYDYCSALSWVDENGKESKVGSIMTFGQSGISNAEGFFITLVDGKRFSVTIEQL